MTVETDAYSALRAHPPKNVRRYPGAFAIRQNADPKVHAYSIIPDRANAGFADLYQNTTREDLALFFKAAERLVCDLDFGRAEIQSVIVLESKNPTTAMQVLLSPAAQPNILCTDTPALKWLRDNRIRLSGEIFELPLGVSEAPQHAVLVLQGYHSFQHFLRQASGVELRRFARKAGAYIAAREFHGKHTRLVIDDIFSKPLPNMAVAHFHGQPGPTP